MGKILYDECFDSADYIEEVTGCRPFTNVSLEECENILQEKDICLWNYPLTEIEHILENDIDVILVKFPYFYGGYEYRLCEVQKEE